MKGDDLSRSYSLFTPPKKVIHDLTFNSLLRQVCLKYKNMLNYNVFLLSPEIKSDICSLVYSDSSMACQKASSLRTILSHQIRFLWFCEQHDLLEFLFAVETVEHGTADTVFHKMFVDKMHDDFVPPDTESLNLVMSAYALYLATGNTIYSQSIKYTTISVYLRDAASLISHMDPVEDRDARKRDNGIIYGGIKQINAEVKRTEKVPNRREGYTIAMHRRLFDKIKFSHIDSKLHVGPTV